MNAFSTHRPKTLSLGPLETEIIEILWLLGPTSATAVHQHILQDIDRELTYSSVSTVLKRLIKKGWVARDRSKKIQVWRTRLSKQQAEILTAQEQLQRFLAVGNPDVVAAFADTLDDESLDRIDAIAQEIQAAREARALAKTQAVSNSEEADASAGESLQ